ncbi:MAG: DUF2905 domain-containing protein [Chloroflexota bacterium]
MFDLQSTGRLLVMVGAVIIILGGMLWLGGRIFPLLGRLPGDIQFQRGNLSCFFPIATSILLSIVLTIVLNLILRFLNR